MRIETASQLPPADVTLLDLAPLAIADIYGDRLPARVGRAYLPAVPARAVRLQG